MPGRSEGVDQADRPQQEEGAAQRLFHDQMDYVRRTIAARGALDEAREALRETEKIDAQAFQAAVTNGGWTAEKLRKMGLATPEKVQRVQRRRRTCKSGAGSATDDAQEQPPVLADANSQRSCPWRSYWPRAYMCTAKPLTLRRFPRILAGRRGPPSTTRPQPAGHFSTNVRLP